MRISYTPEQEELRRELRLYFGKLMTPERRDALSMTSGEYGVANAIRDAPNARSARPMACAEVSEATPDASVMRFTVMAS